MRFRVSVIALAAATLLIVLVTPKSYFGPISSRVRGLFVPHTKTGNPLVDSVAEHQVSLGCWPTSEICLAFIPHEISYFALVEMLSQNNLVCTQ